MPELPEVQTIVDNLNLLITSKCIKITEVRLGKTIYSNSNKRKDCPTKTKTFIDNTVSKTILKAVRIGKNIIIYFTDNSVMIVHLKMTGQLIFYPHDDLNKDKINDKHTHLVFTFTDNSVLIYRDVRKFGYVLFFENYESGYNQLLKKTGHDPVSSDFNVLTLFKIIDFNYSIKKLFLSNKFITGIGNIYSDEILYIAQIHPNRVCNTLKSDDIFRLFFAIDTTLKLAIKKGGSSVSDYLDASGQPGTFSNFHQVYNRAGKICGECNNVLEKMFIAGRGTTFCAKCQV